MKVLDFATHSAVRTMSVATRDHAKIADMVEFGADDSIETDEPYSCIKLRKSPFGCSAEYVGSRKT